MNSQSLRHCCSSSSSGGSSTETSVSSTVIGRPAITVLRCRAVLQTMSRLIHHVVFSSFTVFIC